MEPVLNDLVTWVENLEARVTMLRTATDAPADQVAALETGR